MQTSLALPACMAVPALHALPSPHRSLRGAVPPPPLLRTMSCKRTVENPLALAAAVEGLQACFTTVADRAADIGMGDAIVAHVAFRPGH